MLSQDMMDSTVSFLHDRTNMEDADLYRRFKSFLVLILLGVLASCTPPQPPPGASFKMTPGARFKWKTLCATCHGTFGKGDGAAGMKLNPRPRDFGDPEWQASVTDEYLAKIILEGGEAVGKSKDMPSNPDLKNRAADLRSLVAKIRSFVPRNKRRPNPGQPVKPTGESPPKTK